MASFMQQDLKFYFGQYDLSNDFRASELTSEADRVESTHYNSTAREYLNGLQSVSFSGEGLVDPADDGVDEVLFNNLSVADTLLTVAPTTGAFEEPAYFFKSVQTSYNPGGAIGEVFAFNVNATSRGTPLVKGKVLHAKAARTSTASGTGSELGLVGAGQKLYAGLHIFAKSGTATPTLTVKVQSDIDADFASAVDRITFDAATAVGAQYATPVSGAIADDDFWRVNWTITGTNPSFTFAVVVGIQ